MSMLRRLGRLFGGEGAAQENERAAPPPAAPPPPKAFDYKDDRIPDSAQAKIAHILECDITDFFKVD